MKKKILVILPCYNEEKSIKKVLIDLKKKIDFLVVNDNSSDNSEKILKELKVKYISHNKNYGYDYAIYSGIKYVLQKKIDIFCTFDADGQHTSTDLINMINFFLDENLDLLIGKRKQILRFSEKVFSFYTKKKYGISDIFCGLKIYRVKKCKKYIDMFKENSLGINVALKIVKDGLKYNEYEISENQRNDISRIGSNFRINIKNFIRLSKELLK